MEMVLGITLGLLVMVLAAYRSKKAPKVGVLRRNAMLVLITFALISVPLLTPNGMTVVGLVGLLVIMGLGLLGATMAARYRQGTSAQPAKYVQALVSTGLAAALLIASAQTLSLVSRVDPRVLVLVLGVLAAVLVTGQGLVSNARISSFAMWLLLVPLVIAVALGLGLGNFSVVLSPIRLTETAPFAAVIAMAVVVFLLGWNDTSLAMTQRIGRWSPIRVLSWACVSVLVIALGLLMFFGGAIFAPSMEFFVVPANIDALPGLSVVLLAVFTVLFGALVANALASAGSLGSFEPAVQLSPQADAEDDQQVVREVTDPIFAVQPSWVWAATGIAMLVALIDPSMMRVLVITGLVAAASAGSQLSRDDAGRGGIAGLLAAVIMTVVLQLVGQLTLGWFAIVAMLIVAIVAFVVGRAGEVHDVEELEASVESTR